MPYHVLHIATSDVTNIARNKRCDKGSIIALGDATDLYIYTSRKLLVSCFILQTYIDYMTYHVIHIASGDATNIYSQQTMRQDSIIALGDATNLYIYTSLKLLVSCFIC